MDKYEEALNKYNSIKGTKVLNEDVEEKEEFPKTYSERNKQAIEKYRKLAKIDDNYEINEKNIDEEALIKCSCYCNYDVNDLKEMLIESCNNLK